MFNSIIGSLYNNESPVTSSSSLTTEGHNDNAPSSSEGISEAQRLLLTRVMQRADAKNNSVAPQTETVPLQAEDCSRADLAVARTSRVEEEEQQKRGSEGAGARAQKRVRSRKHDNAVAATSEEQLKQDGKESKKMKSSVQVGRPQTRRFQE
jgi:hypothetical protein